MKHLSSYLSAIVLMASAVTTAAAADGIEMNHLSTTNTLVRVNSDARYLLLPVQESIDDARVNVLVDGNLSKTIYVRLAKSKTDFFVPFDLTPYRGHNVVLDIDVKGALNVKRIYGGRALTSFIEPPSIDELRRRLEGRGTETAETIAVRIGKAEYELGFAADFDVRVVNDDLERAICDTRKVITDFINA